MLIEKARREYIGEYSFMFDRVFSQEPWLIRESFKDIKSYIGKFFEMDNFMGYHMKLDDQLLAVCFGYKRPWIPGYEYYIDQFYIDLNYQGRGYGSIFLRELAVKLGPEIKSISLTTERDIGAYDFYLKNGFQLEGGQRLLYKDL